MTFAILGVGTVAPDTVVSQQQGKLVARAFSLIPPPR
jgi:hypothetical protein